MTDRTPAEELLAAADRLDELRVHIETGADWVIQGRTDWGYTAGPTPSQSDETGETTIAAADTCKGRTAIALVVAAVNASKHLPVLLRDAEGFIQWSATTTGCTQTEVVDHYPRVAACYGIARAINGED